MSAAGWLQLVVLVALVAISTPLLGAHMAAVLGGGRAPGDRVFSPLERAVYRIAGVDPRGEQRWTTYAFSLLAFSLASVLALYIVQRLQGHLPLNPVALIRGLVRRRSGTLGNFWVDLTRGVVRVLLPISLLAAVVFVGLGVEQNLHGARTVTGVEGRAQTIPGGPVASQEVIKELGTNGGGFFNANSAHPYENPAAACSPPRPPAPRPGR